MASPAQDDRSAAPPLREAAPQAFASFVERYAEYMDRVLPGPAGEIARDVSDGLRSMAEEMAALRATACDVVEVYRAALEARSAEAPPRRWPWRSSRWAGN